MSKLPESYGPLEQWKEDYNRDGTASVQAVSRLAHMSRFMVGYQLRSADAHLVLFALTRDAAYLYRAVQVAGSRSPAGRLPNGADPGDSIDAAIPLFSSALKRAEPGTRWHSALLRGQASVLYTRATTTSRIEDWRWAARALVKLLAVIQQDDLDRPAFTASLANARRELAHLT